MVKFAEKNKIIIYVAAMMSLLLLRDVAGISVNKYIFVAISLFMFLSSKETVIYMLCFTFPLLCGLPGNYILLVALIALLCKSIDHFRWQQIVFILVFVVLELIASFWYVSFSVSEITGYLCAISIMIFLLYDDQKIDFEKGMHFFFYGTTFLCLIVFITTIKDAPSNWLSLVATGGFRFGYEMDDSLKSSMSISLNPNSLAYFAIAGIALGFNLLKDSAIKNRLYIICSLLLISAVGFLTISRTFILVGLILILLWLISKINSPVRFFQVALTIFGFTIVLFWILTKYPEVAEGIVSRFSNDTVEGGNGRVDIFLQYNEVFFSNIRFILLGTGVVDYRSQTNVYNSMHSGLQQIFISYGLIFGCIFIAILLFPIIKFIVRKKAKISDLVPLLAVVVFSQTIQFIYPTMLMFPYLIAFYNLKSSGEEV